MKQKTIYQIIIIVLISIMMLSYCNNKPIKHDDIKYENKIIEKTVYDYKDSIIYRDSIIFTYVSIKGTLRKNNTKVLERYKDAQTETKTSLELICDTLVGNLTTEIKILDTIIDEQNKTINHRDTVIHNLEILSDNFEDMLNETEKELIKSEKKIKRKNILLIISTSIAAILTTILIAQ